MSISLKSNVDGSGEIQNGGVKVLTLGADNSVQGALMDTDGFRLSGLPGYNYVINGDFDIWQRGTSQTTSGYGSDDRWYNSNVGSTKTHSQQTFAPGATFPDGSICPSRYSRTVVASVAGAGNYTLKLQRIEQLRSLAGKKAILTFWAKADSNKNIAIEFMQNFGSGGSFTPQIDTIGVTKLALTSTWQRFVVNVEFPNIVGSTIGTDVNSSSTGVFFWLEAGANWNSRTNTLGQQSGTFDIAQVALVEGNKDIKPITRSYGEELQLCKRYYQSKYAKWVGDTTISVTYYLEVLLVPTMRTTPTVTSAQGGYVNGNMNTRAVGVVDQASLSWGAVATNTGPGRGFADVLYIDAEL